MGDVDDNSLKEELTTCRHFLVESEMNNGGQRVYNFAIDSLDVYYLLEKAYYGFYSLKCAAILNIAFNRVLKNVKGESCTYYYAPERNRLLERSKHVATTEHLTKIKNILSNTNFIES